MTAEAIQPGFDIFLSHNSKEKESVRKIKRDLCDLGLKSWLDSDEMPPGTKWAKALEEGLRNSRNVAIIIGQEGVGDWQQLEMETAIDQQVKGGGKVIPLLLPGAPDISELPVFLRNFIVADFRKGLDNPVELKRLHWAITGGQNPFQQSPSLDKAPKLTNSDSSDDREDVLIQNALDDLAASFDSVNITFFIGQGINSTPLTSAISPYIISRELMKNLQLIGNDYQNLLPTIDATAAYFAIGKTDSVLENAIFKQIKMASDVTPPTYQKLSNLLLLAAKRPLRRGQYVNAQLIITTNYDILLERCLLRAGLSFSRLVQHRTTQRIDVNEYKNVRLEQDGGISIDCTSGPSKVVNRNNTHALDELINNCNCQSFLSSQDCGVSTSFSISNLTSPIVYKIHGSFDVPNSCIITIDHHLDFLWHEGRQSNIPAQISEIINNTPILFFGSRILDPDFRFCYQSLLREGSQNQNYPRYALLMKTKDGDESDCGYLMLRKSWDPIKKEALKRYKLEIINTSDELFLDLLLQRLSVAIGG